MVALVTTLERVKEFGGITGTANDAQINRIIRSVSAFVASILPNIALEYGPVTEVYDGGGNSFMLLRQKPVAAVTSVQFAGIEVNTPAIGNPLSTGYLLEGVQPPGIPQRLDLIGYRFPSCRAGITVSYIAGYLAAERHTIPASPYKIDTDDLWTGDQGVAFVGGAALAAVASSPAAGQYSVDAAGQYTFAAADTGKAVTIGYSFIPADIVEAATEMIAERQKAGGARVGVSGMSVAGRESVTYYSRADMNAWAASALQSYMATVPA